MKRENQKTKQKVSGLLKTALMASAICAWGLTATAQSAAVVQSSKPVAANKTQTVTVEKKAPLKLDQNGQVITGQKEQSQSKEQQMNQKKQAAAKGKTTAEKSELNNQLNINQAN